MSHWLRVLSLIATWCLAPEGSFAFSPSTLRAPEGQSAPDSGGAIDTTVEIVRNRRLQPDETLSEALSHAEVPDAQATAAIDALSRLLDLRRLRVGDQLRLVFQNQELTLLEYRRDAFDQWRVQRDQDRWIATKQKIEVIKKVELVDLHIHSSLYESAIAAGEDPSFPMALSDVFAWDVDFYQDVRDGDQAKAIIEKFTVNGRTLRYGEVLGASYQGQSVGEKRVFRYQPEAGEASYFQQDGTSARKAFLKSPLKYANITSRFGSRFHPILQYVRDHNGVDYQAPVGTPVWAVADGMVSKLGHEGGAGNMLCLRHINRLETCYLHLSRFAPLARPGNRVTQKQVIAYTGNTGLCTGPHLHFALKRAGQYVNPLNQKFPRANPVPLEQRADFALKIAPWVRWLNSESVAEVPPSPQ